MIIVVGKRRVNLSQRKAAMLEMNFLGTPPVRDFVQNDSITLVLAPLIQATPLGSISIWADGG